MQPVLTSTGQTASYRAIEKKLSEFLTGEQIEELLEKKHLIRSLYKQKDMQPVMVPPFAVPQRLAQQWTKDSPVFLIETLYLYEKKADTKKNVEKISRTLRAVSDLTGLQYYSSSRKKMRTLYESSYVIDSPAAKNRQPDPLDNTEKDFSVYALQKDLTFGKHIYRYRFLFDEDSSGFISTNTDTLKYSVFKAVKPEDLQVSIAVTDMGGYLLIHGLTRADFTSLSILKKRVQNSFKTRGEAVLQWFIKKYEEGIE